MRISAITKTLSLIVVTAFSTVAFAEESTNTRDIWYLPAQGQFQATLDAEYRATVTDVDFPGAPKPLDRSTSVRPSLVYALSDKFHAGVGFGFSSQKNESFTSATTKESDTASGIEDPSISALYRVLDQKSDSVYLDVLASYSPSIGKKKTKNVLRGSHGLAAGVSIGQQKEAMEYALALHLAYFTEQKFSNGGSYKPRLDWGFDAEFQYDFNDLVSVNAGLEILFPGDLKVKSGTGDDENNDVAYELSAGPEFQINDNLSAGVTLSYGKLTGDISNGPDFDKTTFATAANVDFVF